MGSQAWHSALGRVVVLVVVALGLCVGPVSGASATVNDAHVLLTMPLSDFLAERGSDTRNDDFDWGSDGCTTPPINDLARWNELFGPACTRHDFGYSNFGVHGDQERPPTDARRRAIDTQFRNDMYGICAPLPFFRRVECRIVASAYYNVVSQVGKYTYFYG